VQDTANDDPLLEQACSLPQNCVASYERAIHKKPGTWPGLLL